MQNALTLPDLTWKEKLCFLTAKFLEIPQTECPLKHIFEDGKYIREIVIPMGTLFIGRPHRHGHECQLLSGELVQIEDGRHRHVKAPYTVHTQPGYQMVVQAVTDCVGRSIHPNPDESRDVQKLEDEAFESVESMKLVGRDIAARVEQQWLE